MTKNGAERELEPVKNIVRRSVGLPPASGVTNTELTDFRRQLASVTEQLRRSDGTIDAEKIFELPQKIDELAKRLDWVESYMPKEFTEKDVLEVNKRIERLEGKVALIHSMLANSWLGKLLFR